MAKTSIKKLVSLVLEQVNTRAELNKLFPPDQYIFVEDLTDFPQLFQPINDETPKDIRPDFNYEKTRELEPELDMVAEMPVPKYWQEYMKELDEPLIIPVTMMSRSPASLAKMPEIPRIVSKNPITGEIVEGVAIGTTLITAPSGHEVLEFTNYGVVESGKLNYVVLADEWKVDGKLKQFKNVFLGANVRGKKYEREIERDAQGKLQDKIQTEDDPEEVEKLKRRLKTIREANAKRYGIFPIINSMFSDPSVLDHLDITLVPETWAIPPTTEHTTNRIVLKKFGGDSPEIDADFIAVRDLKDVDTAINDVMDLRAELAMGDTVSDREREKSKHIPRQHANYIYSGGNWHARQRVHDENFFTSEGGKTPIYQLLSKNIQEGNAGVAIKSVLDLNGDVQGDSYVISATFRASLNARNRETGEGEEIGELFTPIRVTDSKPLPNTNDEGEMVDPDSFTLEKNASFFVDQGRTNRNVERTGFLADLINDLGSKIKQDINPDEVLDTMLDLVQTRAYRGREI